jgi:phosphatidylglycerophosphate synthase
MQIEDWTPVHSGAIIAAVAVALIFPQLRSLPTITGAASLGWIWIHQRTVRGPDIVTAIRGIAAILFFFFTSSGVVGAGILLAIAVVAETLDFFDGFLARKLGGSTFGGLWDMEIDAFFILLLALCAYFYRGSGFWVLPAGLYRYLFVFIYRVITPVDVTNRLLGLFMKSSCVTAVIALIIANQSWLPQGLQAAGTWVAFIVLTISFFWEAGYYATAGRRSA